MDIILFSILLIVIAGGVALLIRELKRGREAKPDQAPLLMLQNQLNDLARLRYG